MVDRDSTQGATQTILRAYRVCLDPNRQQLQLLAQHAGFARVGYNWAVAEKVGAWQQQQQHRAWLTYTTYAHLTPEKAVAKARIDARKAHPVPGYTVLSKRYTVERGAVDPATGEVVADGIFPWHKGLNRHAFISGLRNADTAFSNFFDSFAGKRKGRPVGYPRFKKKGRSRDSFSIFHDVKTPSIRVPDSRHLMVPNIGTIRLHSNLRRLIKKQTRGTILIKSVTVAREGDRWFASLLVEEIVPTPGATKRQQTAGTIGVDLGVNRLATLSDGSGIENPRHLRKARARLTKAQRALSRTQKGSANRRKAAARVGRIHARLAEQRRQHLHQITKHLTTAYAAVAIEDLDVAAMTASARGTIDNPGRQVRQKAGLNRAILDVAFGEIVRQLDYKADWYGSDLRKVNRWYPSSKTCSRCGHIKTDLGRGDRTYHCTSCSLTIDRDHNAAINIAHHATRTDPGAKATPQSVQDSTTPTTCDTRDPEAKIGRLEEPRPHHDEVATLIQEDPRGHPGPAMSRRSQIHGAVTNPQRTRAGHHP